MIKKYLLLQIACFILLSVISGDAAFIRPFVSARIALTGGSPEINSTSSSATLPKLKSFIANVKNGHTDLTGVYVSGKFAFKIMQQPSNNAGFVSTQPDALTQFRMASQYNTIGLLGHDYLAGSYFFELNMDQDIVLVKGDGTLKYFRIFEIKRYRALSPNSAYSNFIDLDDNNKLSAEQLFYRIYGKGNTLVLQTCISTETVSSWGRIFVIARPVDHLTPSLDQFNSVVSAALKNISQAMHFHVALNQKITVN
jgi:hypothetical protein